MFSFTGVVSETVSVITITSGIVDTSTMLGGTVALGLVGFVALGVLGGVVALARR